MEEEMINGIDQAAEVSEIIDGVASAGTDQQATAPDNSDRLREIGESVDELWRLVEQRERVSHLIGELRELPRLIPDADALSIDDEGWQSIAEGGSGLAAFVRSEHRKKLAAEANKAGAAASAGAVSGGIGAVYSVDEIRQMDRSTVRKNLDKVLSSLEAVGG